MIQDVSCVKNHLNAWTYNQVSDFAFNNLDLLDFFHFFPRFLFQSISDVKFRLEYDLQNYLD